MLTGTVIFSEWQGNYYDCWVDGSYEGLIAPGGYLYAYGVSLGYHSLYADYVSGGGTGWGNNYTDTYYVSSGSQYWDFNRYNP